MKQILDRASTDLMLLALGATLLIVPQLLNT